MSFRLKFDGFIPRLILLSLFYLSIPYIIFFIGWLKWPLAILCVAAVVIALAFCIKGLSQLKNESLFAFKVKSRDVLLVFLLCLVVLSVSGVGGYGFQDFVDWRKHNAILADLVELPWPAFYKYQGQAVPLVYYIAFYLPAALVGKIAGWFWANQALFIWSLIGFTLAMLWFMTLVQRRGMMVPLLFVLFSGLDAAGRFLLISYRPSALKEFVIDFSHIEHWANGWQYSSNTTLVFWVPNQALAGWIATALVIFASLYWPNHMKKHQIFYLGLTVLWSPFAAIGLIPFILSDFLSDRMALTKRIDQYLSQQNLVGFGLLTIVGLFYGAQQFGDQQLLDTLGGKVGVSIGIEFTKFMLALLFAFYIFEFGIFGVLILWGRRKVWDTKTLALFVTSIACMFLFPIIRVGDRGMDFTMRASIPALFVLATYLGSTVFRRSTSSIVKVLLVLLVLIGSITAVVEFRRHIMGIYDEGTMLQTPEEAGLWEIYEQDDNFPIGQYIGNSQTFFFQSMAKPDIGDQGELQGVP